MIYMHDQRIKLLCPVCCRCYYPDVRINDRRVYGLACWVLFNMPRASRDEMGREFCSCDRAHLETCDELCGSVVLRA